MSIFKILKARLLGEIECQQKLVLVFFSASITAIITNIVFSYVAFYFNNWLAFSINTFSAVILIFNVYFYYIKHKFGLAANILLAVVCFAIFLQQICADQPYPHIYLWGCLIPVFAAILIDRMASFAWAIIVATSSSCAFLITYFSDVNLFLPFHIDKIVTYNPTANFLLALNVSILGGFVVAFFVASELKHKRERIFQANNRNQLLLNVLTHDVSTPMQVLNMSLVMLQRMPLQQIQFEKLDMMKKTSEDLETLLKEVRNINAVATGKIKINLQNISLRDLINKTIKSFVDIKPDLDNFVTIVEQPKSANIYIDEHLFLTYILIPIFRTIIEHRFIDGNIEISVKRRFCSLLIIIKSNNSFVETAKLGPALVGAKVVAKILGGNLDIHDFKKIKITFLQNQQ